MLTFWARHPFFFNVLTLLGIVWNGGGGLARATSTVEEALVNHAPLSIVHVLTSMIPASSQETMNVALRVAALVIGTVLVKLMMSAQISATNRHYMPVEGHTPHALHRFFVGLTIIVKGFGPLIVYAGCFYGLLNTLPLSPLWSGFNIMGYGIGLYLAADLVLSSLMSPRLASHNRLSSLNERNNRILLWVLKSFAALLVLVYALQQIMIQFHLEDHFTQGLIQSLVLGGSLYASIVVLMARKPVSEWLESRESEEPDSQKVHHFFTYLAHIWHMLAIGSIMVVCSVWVHQGTGELSVITKGAAWTLVALLGSKILFQLIQNAQQLLIQHQNDEKTPYKERLILERLNVYLPYLFKFTKGIILFFAFMVALEGWGIQSFSLMNIPWIVFLLRTIIENYIVALVFIVIWEVFNVITNYYMRPRTVNGQQVVISARAKTLLPLVRMIGRVLIVLVGGLMVLSTLGVNIAPLIAGLSVFGLAISFGSQTLVKDFVTGLFILLENDVEVGDTVSIGGSIGLVEATTVRNIKLRDGEGALHIIPYSAIEGLINLSRDYTASTLEFTIGHHENIDAVMALIREVSDELQKDSPYQDKILAPVIILGVKSISELGLTILAKLRTKPDPHHLIVLEFYRRIKEKYDAHNIQIPVPQRSVYVHNTTLSSNAPPSLS